RLLRQPELFALSFQGCLVGSERFLVAPGTDALVDHRKGATVARGAVRIGTVDHHAVVGDHITGIQANGNFTGLIFWSVVGRALRETEDFGTTVRSQAALVRAGDVAQTTVLFIHAVEGHPDRDDAGRLQAEVVVVLVRRCGMGAPWRLVE